MTATLEEFLCSAQVIAAAGNPNIILCERGIRTFETATRNTLDIAAVPVLKAVSHLPVVVDPSHAAGVRSLVPVLSRAAAVVDADGLLIEVHPCPEQALSDGNQSLNFAEFRRMMARSSALPGFAARVPSTPSATSRGRRSGLVSSRPILVIVLLLIVIAPAKPASESAAITTIPPLLYTASQNYDPLAWLKGSDRFSGDAAIYTSEGGRQRPLIPDFAKSADPSVSFDGKRALFAGKAHAQDPWQIWEIDLP